MSASPGEDEGGGEIAQDEAGGGAGAEASPHEFPEADGAGHGPGVDVLEGAEHDAGPHEAIEADDDAVLHGSGQRRERKAADDGADAVALKAGSAEMMKRTGGAAFDDEKLGEALVEDADEGGFALDAEIGGGVGKIFEQRAGDGAGAGAEFEDGLTLGDSDIAGHGAREHRGAGRDGADARGVAHGGQEKADAVHCEHLDEGS